MQKKWKIILGSAAALLIIIIVVVQSLQGIEVDVQEVTRSDIAVTFSEDGKVVSPEERTVHPLTSARVCELLVEEGDRVNAGDLLATLEDDEMHYQVQELQARLKRLEGEGKKLYQEPGEAEIESQQIAIDRAEESKEQAQTDYERMKKLYEEGVIPRTELERTENLLQDARKNLELQEESLQVLKESYDPPRGSDEILQAEKEAILSQIQLLEHQKDNYRVEAPTNGKIIRLQANEGELATPEMPMMELFAPEGYEVETEVLVRDVYEINQGMTVALTLEKRDKDVEFSGEVIEIAPYAEEDLSPLGLEEERVRVTIAPDYPEDLQLAPGYELEVEFITEEQKDQLVVPERAVFSDNGEDALFMVENGRAQVQKVTTGLETDTQVAITEGLSEGDIVIVDHQLEDIDEGSRIEVSSENLTNANIAETAGHTRILEDNNKTSGQLVSRQSAAANDEHNGQDQKENKKTPAEEASTEIKAETGNAEQSARKSSRPEVFENLRNLASQFESTLGTNNNTSVNRGNSGGSSSSSSNNNSNSGDTSGIETSGAEEREKLEDFHHRMVFGSLADARLLAAGNIGNSISLTLAEASQKALENSKDLARLEWVVDRLNVQKDQAEDKVEDLYEEWDDLRQMYDLFDNIEDIVETEKIDNIIKALKEELENDDNDNGSNNDGDDNNNNEEENDEGENNENENDTNELPTQEFMSDLLALFNIIEEEMKQENLEEIEDILNQNMIDDLEETMEEQESRAEEEIKDARTELEKQKKVLDQQITLVEKRKENLKEQLKLKAKAIYVELLSVEEQKEVVRENMDNAAKQVEHEKKKLDAGKSTSHGVNLVKLQEKELKNNYYSLESEYENASAHLSSLLDYPTDTSFNLESISVDMKELRDKFDFEKVLEDALDEGWKVKYAERKIQHAEDNKEFWDEDNEDDPYKYALKEIELKEAEADAYDARQKLRVKEAELRNSYQETMNNYALAERAYLVKKDALEAKELKQELGKATSLEVSEAVADKNEAQKELTQLEYQAFFQAQKIEMLQNGYLVEEKSFNNN